MSALIVTAKINKLVAHPDAKKLKLCTVFDGKEEHQIVCGAANAREGMITVLAKTGATLSSGMKIEKANLRGVDSYGMLCSAKELGLVDEGGIVDLPPDTKLGEDFNNFSPELFSSIPWFSFEEKEALWQKKNSKEITVTRNGTLPENEDQYILLSKTYWKDGEYLHRHFL